MTLKYIPFANPQFANTLYPETLPQKSYYTKEKSIYGEHTDEALDKISNILTATLKEVRNNSLFFT